jgi:hypothetical protein
MNIFFSSKMIILDEKMCKTQIRYISSFIYNGLDAITCQLHLNNQRTLFHIYQQIVECVLDGMYILLNPN